MEKRTLSNENISSCIEEQTAFYKKHGIDKQSLLRDSLALEEILLQFQSRFGEEHEFMVTPLKRMGYLLFRISVCGEQFNPLDKQNYDEECFSRIMARLNLAPSYQYESGCNIVYIRVGKTAKSPVLTFFLTMGISAGCALITRRFPQNVQAFIVNEIFQQIIDLFSIFFKAISGPVVFLTVMAAIINTGDLSSLKKMGSHVMKRMFLLSVSVFLISMVIPLLMTGIHLEGTTGSPFAVIRDTLFSIIPPDIITPFQQNSILQILFWSVLISVALLSVSSNESGISQNLITLNNAFTSIMSAMTKLLPIFIFSSLFLFFLREPADLLKTGTFILYAAVSYAVMIILMLAADWIYARISPLKIIRYSFNTMAMAAITHNSLLVLPALIKDLSQEDKYALDEKEVKFITPLSQILFKPALAIWDCSFILAIFSMEGQPVSLSQLFTLMLVTFIFSIATPCGAGGGLAVVAAIFKLCNVNMEYLALVLSIDTLLDGFITAVVSFGSVTCTLLCSQSLKKR